MSNAGYKAEVKVVSQLEKAGIARFKRLNGEVVEFPINDRMTVFGFSTKTKVDLIVEGYRLQIKATGSKRAAIVNMVPARLLDRVCNEQMLDVEQSLKAMNIINDLGKKIKLSDYFEKEEWRELINYFLFEGTATGQADPFMQATHLLEVDGDELVLIDKKEAFDHIWEGLEAEIRTRKDKVEPCLHIRYSAK